MLACCGVHKFGIEQHDKMKDSLVAYKGKVQ